MVDAKHMHGKQRNVLIHFVTYNFEGYIFHNQTHYPCEKKLSTFQHFPFVHLTNAALTMLIGYKDIKGN